MLARGGASLRAQPLGEGRRKPQAPEGRQNEPRRFRRPSRASFLFASVPGVALEDSLHPWLTSAAPPGLTQAHAVDASASNEEGRERSCSRPSGFHSHFRGYLSSTILTALPSLPRL